MFADVATWLLDPSGLTPHGFCLLWDPGLIWLQALSDLAIAIAYFTIPVFLATFARRRRDLVFKPVFWLFATFILLCGTTHLLSILTLFVPAYWLDGIVKAITAVVSLVTAAALWPLLPKALALPSPSQLQQANDALQASEAHLRTSFERSPVPMQIVDADSRLVAVSDTWLQLLGYERADVVGRPIADFLQADLQPTPDPPPDGDFLTAGRRFVRHDRSVVETEVSFRFERVDENAGSVGVVVDISARRRAEAALRVSEERLHQAQKMEAVGQLTGGIAHDFNNMLQAMSGGLEMLERRITEGRPEKLIDYVNAVRTSLDRAAGLTQRMLAFARRQALQPFPTDVAALVKSLEELIGRTLGPTITLTLQLEGACWHALCDPNQLESALVNLAINARDAMPDGGKLEIVTRDRTMTNGDLSAADEAAPGDYVEIVVSDTGTGMTPEIKARAFEPFFTTKPIGQGTGLGLSQLYGFVRQSGGLVRLDSEPLRGTTVSLLLPRSTEPVPLSTPRSKPANIVARINGVAPRATVLIVDDEPTVRILVAEMLRDMNLDVLEATDGVTALHYLQHSPALDLLITDVGLPGLNGRQIAEAARENHPGLPILLITGYAGDAIEAAALPQGMVLIYKPFSLQALAGQVLASLQLDGSPNLASPRGAAIPERAGSSDSASTVRSPP